MIINIPMKKKTVDFIIDLPILIVTSPFIGLVYVLSWLQKQEIVFKYVDEQELHP